MADNSGREESNPGSQAAVAAKRSSSSHSGKKKGGKRWKKCAAPEDDDNSKSTAEKKHKKEKKMHGDVANVKHQRPNMFIALQISNPSILEALASVQIDIMSEDPSLAELAVPIAKAHITLHVFLEDEVQIEKISAAVARASIIDAAAEDNTDLKVGDEVSHLHHNTNLLTVSGLGQFGGGRVVYAKVSGSIIGALWWTLKKELTEVGVHVSLKPLVPHVTLFKSARYDNWIRLIYSIFHFTLFRASTPQGRKRKVERELYQRFETYFFGTQMCSSVQLLSMTRPASKDTGYYYMFKKFPLALTRPDVSCEKAAVRASVREKVCAALPPPPLPTSPPSSPTSSFVNPKTLLVCSIVSFAACCLFYYKKSCSR